MSEVTAAAIITWLGLRPLPIEGGYFAETHRHGELPRAVLGERYPASRAASTAIYYLLTPDTKSALHRLPGPELYHFYLGDPVEQLWLFPDGHGERHRLGPDLLGGELVQVAVPGSVWQGSRLAPGGRHGFALLGTTMSPGFDAADYEHGDRAVLIATYPTFRDDIVLLTDDEPAACRAPRAADRRV